MSVVVIAFPGPDPDEVVGRFAESRALWYDGSIVMTGKKSLLEIRAVARASATRATASWRFWFASRACSSSAVSAGSPKSFHHSLSSWAALPAAASSRKLDGTSSVGR